jgi:hypothetical protein
MTGPEHYRIAERLLRDEYRTDRSVAEAQVHATLALAAATAAQTSVMAFRDDINDADVDNWHNVAGPAPEGGTDRG